MKGEPRKYDRKLARTQAKFPLRTIEIGEDFLSCNQEFFEMYDFIFLMFTVVVILFAATSTIHVLPFEWATGLIETSLTYYMTLLVLVLVVRNLMKNTFNLGWFKYTDETKMEIFMALKALIFTWALFTFFDSRAFFEYHLDGVHAEFNERLNQALAPFGAPPKVMPFEATLFVFGTCAALLSFSIVRVQIRFAYFLYVFTTSKDYDDTVERDDTPEVISTKKLNGIVKCLLYINFLLPLLVLTLFVNPLSKSLLVPNVVSDGGFQVLKSSVVVIAGVARTLTFRRELQH